MKFLAMIFFLIFFLCGAPAPGQVELLGNLESYQQTPDGLLIQCEAQKSLEIRFLAPGVFRCIAASRTDTLPLLNAPLIPLQPAPPALQFKEEDLFLRLKSRDIELIIHKYPCRLTVLSAEGKVIHQDEPGLGIGWEDGLVQTWKTLIRTEQFVGLGDQAGPLNRRGQRFQLSRTGADSSAFIMPFFMGINPAGAYGIYLNSAAEPFFDFGSTTPRFFTFGCRDAALDYFFIYGPRPDQVMSNLSEILGKPVFLPRMMLEPHLSRANFTGAGILPQFNAARLNLLNSWDGAFPADSGQKMISLALENDLFLRYPDGERYLLSKSKRPYLLMNFAKSYARDWLLQLPPDLLPAAESPFFLSTGPYRNLPASLIIDGERRRKSVRKTAGLLELALAEAANLLQQRSQPDSRPGLLIDGGFSGVQRYAATLISPAAATGRVAGETIPHLMNLILSGGALSGIRFADHRADHGLASQLLPFLPVFIIPENWLARASRYQHHPTQEQAQILEALRMRRELAPLLYTLNWEASESGVAPIRPLFWYNPLDSLCFDPRFQQQFFLGEGLLIVPAPGGTTDSLYLPPGKWLAWPAGEIWKGGQIILPPEPPDKPALFLKDGAVIPRKIEKEDRQTLALEVFPQRDYGNFLLYEDDGVHRNYPAPRQRLTQFEFLWQKGKLSFTRTLMENHFSIGKRFIQLRFWGFPNPPRRVKLNGRKLKAPETDFDLERYYEYDPQRRLLIVHFEESGKEQKIEIRR